MNALKNERGLSLVEVTIMLLVLMLLTGVLAPSIYDFINDAKWVKVKEDCEAIGLTVARVTRDVGPCLKFYGDGPCEKWNRVELLHSDGPAIQGQDWNTGVWNENLKTSWLNWDSTTGTDSMESQFVSNGGPTPYPTPTQLGSSNAGLQFGLGWRGAYLAPPIGPDPWGHMYLVNSAFLAVSVDASGNGAPMGGESLKNHGGGYGGGSGEGSLSGGWSYDTFCISAGPNGSYETPVGGNGRGGVTRTGDDFIYIISGGTR